MIIFVTDRTASSFEPAVLFCERGLFSYICRLEDAPDECERKEIGGVILDCRDDLAAAEELCRCLRCRYPALPIAAWVTANVIPNLPATRVIKQTEGERLLEELMDFCVRACGWKPMPLSTYELTLDEDGNTAYYMGYPLTLQGHRLAILRCLLYQMPKPLAPNELLALACPNLETGCEGLRVQIARINKCARRIDGRPLIVFEEQTGYRLREGICPPHSKAARP